MNIRPLLVVARKELTDALRDRRALIGVVIGTLFGPLLIGFLFTKIAGQEKAARDIEVPVVGRQYAPLLMRWMEQQPGVRIVDGPADPETAVRDSKAEFVLVVQKEFGEKFRDSRPAPVQLVADSTRQSTRAKVRRLNSLLRAFSSETGGLRLIARGVSPAVANALKVEEVEVSNAGQRAAMLFNFIPMFLILTAFSAGMQIATDSTAGERERGSLEPLLINPAPRWQLLGGKWLAAVCMAMVGMVLTLLTTAQAVRRLPLEDLGVRFSLGAPQMLLLIVATAPMVLLAPAVQIYLASFAKSFKEAQSYMGFLIMGATIPGVFASLYPLGNQPWMRPLPVLGQYVLNNEILSGKVPSPAILVFALVLALVIVAIFLRMAMFKLTSEKIIFGR